ncbi:sensor histidine kinase [Pseudonocardia broussonetiae]|uniref:histidine kinase n=1 Tax=Pseudonocardia broussonetiae TaxID=2736640 RepID=A0A6M6JR38_9PSEU|nr:sensor histidine kinase [Pseudonocardia broussonetiae]QJY48859.1 sensor histidine kinase [Pseudonocardia broussonetiae]
MTSTDPARRRRHGAAAPTVAALVLAVLVAAETATAVVAAVAAGWTLDAAVEAFVVSNAVIGLSCGVAGVLLAGQRPGNPVGWLLLGAAVAQSGTAASTPLLDLAATAGAPTAVLRALATVAAWSWPWSIGLFLPLALLLFPDGRLPGPRWRAAAGLTAVSGLLFATSVGADPAGVPTSRGPVAPWPVLPGYAGLAPLWTGTELLNLAVYVLAVAALVLRYRRGDEQRRRQLLWLVLALLLVTVIFVPWGLFDAGPVLQLLAIALVPGAMTVAVLRHQLLDIRLVLSRTVVYLLLTALVTAAYLGLVALGGTALRGPVVGGTAVGDAVLATLVVAVAFHPVRTWLQRLVDRALYGDRSDPARALAGVGERLRAADASSDSAGGGVDAALAAVCEALRLPYAAVVRDGGVRWAHGTAPGATQGVPLVYRGEDVGELVVGARPGQRSLGRADRAACEVLAVPLAVAVRATDLSATLQRSRERIVAAREEERRRLRRDLHDGLGPVLTGISFQADAAGNLLATDPAAAAAQLTALRAAATEAIADVRRLVLDLRPPALDEVGLVEALRRHAVRLGTGTPAVVVHAEDPLPALPAAVEVAAYRIAAEAMTNAVRHSGGDRVDLRISVADGLRLDVRDDGRTGPAWTPGTGMTSMTERAAELGGTVVVGPSDGGGRVAARLPL